MASRQRNGDELLRAVELHHEQYLKSLKALLDAAFVANRPGSSGALGTSRMERSGSADTSSASPILPAIVAAPPSPFQRPAHTLTLLSESALPGLGGVKRSRRGTNELPERQGSLGVDRKHVPVSLYEADSDADDDINFVPLQLLPPSQSPRTPEDRIPSVQRALSAQSYGVDDLVHHIHGLDESRGPTVTVALEPVWNKRAEVDAGNVLSAATYGSPDHDVLYANATYEVYDVGRDALAVQQHDSRGNADDVTLEAATVWATLKDVNRGGNAVGRMTILQEPSPLMLAVAHMTMGKHFDMDELYQHLVSTKGNKGKTKACMYRAFESTSIRRRTFFFVFKYYTAVSEGLAAAPWQQFDQRSPDKKQQDHIDIAECSSVLALSLEGIPMKEIHLRYKKKRPVQVGHVSDPFAPWHLLSVQSFPDDRHSMRSEDVKKPFYNGPFAFLDSLAAEYRDAVKRYTKLHELIAKLITPPNEFMFEVKIRDLLLFEDKNFTYSRRYFWAYNTLGVINEGIKAMISAYTDTFTADFWAGRHQFLWPLQDASSAESVNYLNTMSTLRHEIDRAVDDLRKVMDKNERTRKEIANLREQLFSGSSVRESRRAVEQGDNIKILTSVSMVFLPLTFVTSVFGITEFTIPANDWRFPVVMVCVCVPFFLLIVVLQTRVGMEIVKKVGSAVDALFNPDRVRYIRERKVQLRAAKVHEESKKVRRFGRKRRRVLGVDMSGGGESANMDGAGRGWWRWRNDKASADVGDKANEAV